ncbi:MAG: hypothetical protein K0R17_821 [Rariglobus sp.]|jgi:hypothetical protein|nr:hypothetical protein [Rariglobus sp.]
MNLPVSLPMDARWIRLQTELRDLAFVLDRQGSHAAADLATIIAARIDELHTAELEQDAGACG